MIFQSHTGFTQISISGEVVSQSEEAQPYATVLLLLSVDSTLAKGAVSDENGQFIIQNVMSGNYLVSVSMIGFETSYSTSFSINESESYEMGKITLIASEIQIKGIDVIARKPLYEQQIDRMVINIHNSITSAGGNALEVLARSPGITVNEINNVLHLNGKKGVLVMIDEKQTYMPVNILLDVLRGMDAGNIEKIELYDTPPAHLDAEGNGGVINIVKKKNNKIGTNGSYSLNLGYGKRFKYGGTVNLNYRNNKLNLYGSYSFRHRFSERTYYFDRRVNKQGVLIETDSENKRRGEALRNSVQLGLDYSITDKTIFGFLVSGYLNDSENASVNNSTFSETNIPFSVVDNTNEEENLWKHGMLNLNVQHFFQKEESISFDIDYLYYQNDNPSNYLNKFFDGEHRNLLSESEVKVKNTSPINNVSTKVDYKKNFNDKIEFQLGVKGTSSRFDNLIEVSERVDGGNFINTERFSQDYELKEDIGAVYSALNFQLNEKTNMNFGLRYEYTDYNLTVQNNPNFLDRKFDYFFPSFFFSRTINERDQFQFSYGRRITRPSFNELAPFVTFIDPSTFFKGNPELQPGISNNIRTSYRFKNVLLSLQYGYSENPIVTYQPVLDPNTNTQIYTTLNLDEEQTASLSLLVPLHPTKWWEIQNKFLAGFEKITMHSDDGTFNLETKTFTANITNSFILPKDFILEISGQYQSPSYYGLLKVKSKGFVNIGLQKKMSNNNGTLRINCSDIFQTNIWRSSTTVPELNLDNRLKLVIETRIFRLTYSTTFGNAKIKNKRNRKTSSEEARRRVY